MKRVFRLGAVAMALALPLAALAAPLKAALYKNPQCTCCDDYAQYLRDNGFEVAVTPTDDLDRINRDAGVPQALAGCHTVLVDGYAVSGHVPVEAVRRLLAERPAIAGITLPGMPAGSPGMGGQKAGPFAIQAIARDGSTRIYDVR